MTATSPPIYRAPGWHSHFPEANKQLKLNYPSSSAPFGDYRGKKRERKTFLENKKLFVALLLLLFPPPSVRQLWIINSHIENNSIKLSRRFEVAVMLVFCVCSVETSSSLHIKVQYGCVIKFANSRRFSFRRRENIFGILSRMNWLQLFFIRNGKIIRSEFQIESCQSDWSTAHDGMRNCGNKRREFPFLKYIHSRSATNNNIPLLIEALNWITRHDRATTSPDFTIDFSSGEWALGEGSAEGTRKRSGFDFDVWMLILPDHGA